ncbi:hypothetical protein AGRA3207_007509 [Actinomadura graeca]|uniref:Phosphoadenosine phosphosulfate reductase n=1 Tax=Actinomadura graeca TaxID=2750812 RepID=A0ABX8R4I2_9ACTN|nr:hypothetical protein [Actinomadura graeca]QXJ25940.1 hypothetical protein AGRA3207_007509 [Actinomadura graeca]
MVLSYGLGKDSTAILLRWIQEPRTRPCRLENLLVVTTMTGDEWPVTGALVQLHVLPLLRRHRIRFAQVARDGPSQRDGIAVLDDSRDPRTLYLEGAYRLHEEMRAAGTLPQLGGARLCSAKSKGVPLDVFVAHVTRQKPYLHAVGYEIGETSRAVRDATFDTVLRTGYYPLREWGWDRAACDRYIRGTLGVTWPKSACVYCPFTFQNKASRIQTLERFVADPQAGLLALEMEYLAVALNPRQGLLGRGTLSDLLAQEGRQDTLRLFHQHLDRIPWACYEVRRALLPRAGDPAKTGTAAREVRVRGTGSRQRVQAELAAFARRAGVPVDTGGAIARAWLLRRGPQRPTAEWFAVAAPQGALPKQGPAFESAWTAATGRRADHPAEPNAT